MTPCGHVNKHNVEVAFLSPLSLFSICRGAVGSAARCPTCSSNYPHYWLIFHVERRVTRGRHAARRDGESRHVSNRSGAGPATAAFTMIRAGSGRWRADCHFLNVFLTTAAVHFVCFFFVFFCFNPSSLFFPPSASCRV